MRPTVIIQYEPRACKKATRINAAYIYDTVQYIPVRAPNQQSKLVFVVPSPVFSTYAPQPLLIRL